MSKLFFDSDAKSLLKNSIDEIASAVASTFGPNGRTVIINDGNEPKVTKDGVSVARAISSSNPCKNTGYFFIKEAAEKTAKEAGDGTTTSTIITQQLIHLVTEALEKGISHRDIRAALEEDFHKVSTSLLKEATPIEGNLDLIKHIALTSSNYDEEVAEVISTIYNTIGLQGIISLEKSNSLDGVNYSIVEGIQLNRGFNSAYYINDHTNKVCTLSEPDILIFDGIINDGKQLFRFLEGSAKTNTPLVLIAHDFSPDVEKAVLNNVRGELLKAVTIKIPGTGEYRTDLLKDIAVLTNGGVNTSWQNITLGKATSITASRTDTSIIGGYGDTATIAARVAELKASLNNDLPQYLIEDVNQRIAKLSGGIAAIFVGAPTELERTERMDRIEDAVCAVSSAISEGVVPGGGLIQERLSNVLSEDSLLRLALLRCRNILTEQSPFLTPEYIQANNVVDPAKVTRVSIKNALSVVYMYLSTDCVIVNSNIEYEYDSQQKIGYNQYGSV